MTLSVGDEVWYATMMYGQVWRSRVTHVPSDPRYEVEIHVVEGGMDITTTRPRRRLFHNELDARNAAV